MIWAVTVNLGSEEKSNLEIEGALKQAGEKNNIQLSGIFIIYHFIKKKYELIKYPFSYI